MDPVYPFPDDRKCMRAADRVVCVGQTLHDDGRIRLLCGRDNGCDAGVLCRSARPSKRAFISISNTAREHLPPARDSAAPPSRGAVSRHDNAYLKFTEFTKRGLRIEDASRITCRILVLQRHLARLTRLSVSLRSEASTPSCRLSGVAFAGLLVWEQRG